MNDQTVDPATDCIFKCLCNLLPPWTTYERHGSRRWAQSTLGHGVYVKLTEVAAARQEILFGRPVSGLVRVRAQIYWTFLLVLQVLPGPITPRDTACSVGIMHLTRQCK